MVEGGVEGGVGCRLWVVKRSDKEKRGGWRSAKQDRGGGGGSGCYLGRAKGTW